MTDFLHKEHAAKPSQQKIMMPQEILQQINLEDEFSAELALLKKQRLEPRPQAIAELLHLIQTQTAVEH